jgi:hypothetical protein
MTPSSRPILLFLSLLTAAPAAAQGLFEEAVNESKAGGDKQDKPGDADAADKGEGTGLSGSLGGLGFELNGHLRGAIYLGKVPDKDATETKAGYGEAGLKLRARKGEWGDAFSELRFRAGYEGGSTDYVFDLREAYVNAYLGPVDLRLGHQIIIWGRADGVNPTNNLTPRDMRLRSPSEDDQRLANLALRAHLNYEPFRWELVWVPFFKPSTLPFDLNGASSPLAGAAPPGFELALDPPIYPNANIKNGTVATRVHLNLSAVEGSLSYLIGTSTFPGVRLMRNPPDVVLALATYRHQVVGADFSTALLGFGVRGEFAFRSPFDYETREHVPNPELQYVLGFDREFFGQLNVIAQYSGKTVLDWQEVDEEVAQLSPRDIKRFLGLMLLEPKNRMIAGQLEQVQHSATLRLAWTALQETLKLEALGMFNFTTEEVMLRPKVTYDITDALTAAVGAELYFGPDETLFGTIQTAYSAGFAELRASF